MRIVHLSCVYPPYGGGIGEVARQYASLLTAEHQVTVITPSYHPAMTFMNTPGVNVVAKKPLLAWGKAAWLPGLKSILDKFDAVHLHYPFFGVQERLVNLNPRIKLIITYHMLPQTSGGRGWLMKASLNYTDKRIALRADVLTAATADYIKSVALPRMGQAEKWQVVTFGVDDRFFPGDEPERLVRKFNVRYGEAVILFVATLDKAHAFKGLSILLRALTRLNNRNWKLIVVGGGSWRNRYQQQARALKLGKQAIFAGYVPVAELPDYYRLASVFVLPSVNSAEAFGLVALEAMATGLPVIASRLPGVRELVIQGENGLLVEPGDELGLAAALEGLLNSPEQRTIMGQKAFKRVQENYRWPVVGQRLLDIYRQLS